jgi:small subunit ribosomal protein S20
MANIKSQIKRNRQNEKARQRNKAVRSEIKTRTKHAEEATGEEAAELAKAAVKRIDQAAAKGVLHKNTAARQKSRLMKKVNAAS